MIPNLAGTEDAIGADVDSFGGDDGAAVEPGVPADADDRLRAGRDEPVDLGMRPGVDICVQYHLAGPLDAQPAIPEQSWSDANPRVETKGQAGEPAETEGRRLFQLHVRAITRQRTTLPKAGECN